MPTLHLEAIGKFWESALNQFILYSQFFILNSQRWCLRIQPKLFKEKE